MHIVNPCRRCPSRLRRSRWRLALIGLRDSRPIPGEFGTQLVVFFCGFECPRHERQGSVIADGVDFFWRVAKLLAQRYHILRKAALGFWIGRHVGDRCGQSLAFVGQLRRLQVLYLCRCAELVVLGGR